MYLAGQGGGGEQVLHIRISGALSRGPGGGGREGALLREVCGTRVRSNLTNHNCSHFVAK